MGNITIKAHPIVTPIIFSAVGTHNIKNFETSSPNIPRQARVIMYITLNEILIAMAIFLVIIKHRK